MHSDASRTGQPSSDDTANAGAQRIGNDPTSGERDSSFGSNEKPDDAPIGDIRH